MPSFEEDLEISSKLILRSPWPKTKPWFIPKNKDRRWLPFYWSIITLLRKRFGSESLNKYDFLHFLNPPYDFHDWAEYPPKIALSVLTKSSNGPLLSQSEWNSSFLTSGISESLYSNFGAWEKWGRYLAKFWSLA